MLKIAMISRKKHMQNPLFGRGIAGHFVRDDHAPRAVQTLVRIPPYLRNEISMKQSKSLISTPTYSTETLKKVSVCGLSPKKVGVCIRDECGYFMIAHLELKGQVIKGANTGVMMPVLASQRDTDEKARCARDGSGGLDLPHQTDRHTRSADAAKLRNQLPPLSCSGNT
jgi:hypothetical protein